MTNKEIEEDKVPEEIEHGESYSLKFDAQNDKQI